MLCAIRCLAGSAIFHNFLCVSRKWKDILQTLDYSGICILICGSYVPVIYYSFYCYPSYLRFHLTAVITINVLTVCVLATPKFRYFSSSILTHSQPKYRSVRSICFTAVACYAVIALIHLYILDRFNNPIFTSMTWYVVGMGSTYIIGAYFYGSRVPEKYYPGYFDYVVGLEGMSEV